MTRFATVVVLLASLGCRGSEPGQRGGERGSAETKTTPMQAGGFPALRAASPAGLPEWLVGVWQGEEQSLPMIGNLQVVFEVFEDGIACMESDCSPVALLSGGRIRLVLGEEPVLVCKQAGSTGQPSNPAASNLNCQALPVVRQPGAVINTVFVKKAPFTDPAPIGDIEAADAAVRDTRMREIGSELEAKAVAAGTDPCRELEARIREQATFPVCERAMAAAIEFLGIEGCGYWLADIEVTLEEVSAFFEDCH